VRGTDTTNTARWGEPSSVQVLPGFFFFFVYSLLVCDLSKVPGQKFPYTRPDDATPPHTYTFLTQQQHNRK